MNIQRPISMCKQQFSMRKARSLRARVLVATLMAAVVAGQPPLAAAEAPAAKRVLMVKTQRHAKVPSLVPTRIFTYVHTMLRLNNGLKVMTPDTLAAHKPTQARVAVQVDDPTLKRADVALDEAKELVNQRKFMSAQKRFRKASALYDKKLHLLEDFDKYVDALLGRSISYFLAGYDDNGEDELARVVTLRPSVIIDKRRAPAAAVKALDRIATLYTRAGTGSLSITSNAADALVYVDGIVKGKAPLTVDGLYRGRHFVRVLAPGYTPIAKPTVVSPGKTTSVKVKSRALRGKKKKVLKSATTEELLSAAQTGVYDRQLLKGMKGLCQEHQLAGILLSYVRKTDRAYELAGFYYDPGANAVAEMKWVEVDRNLATVQVAAMELSEQVLAATKVFPKDRLMRGVSPIYQEEDPAPAAVVPVAAAVAVVAVAAPVSAPVAPVKVQPVVATPPPVIAEAPPTVMRESPTLPEQIADNSATGTTHQTHQFEDPNSKSWYQKWWVWTLIGVAAAGTATAVILTTNSSDAGQAGYSTTATW